MCEQTLSDAFDQTSIATLVAACGVPTAQSVRDSGKLFAALGYTFTAIAAAGLVTSAILFVVSGKSQPAPVAFSVTAGGGAYITFARAF